MRIFFGADVTDEAQYVASAYLPIIGGKPFFNELYIQQTASLIYSPFVGLYSYFFGSLTGIILTIRHLYFVFASVTALSAYLYFRFTCDRLLAFALSSLFITFIPFCLPSLSYNTIGYLGINCFFIWSAISLKHPQVRTAILSGFFASLSVWAYPTLALPISAYYLISILVFFKEKLVLRNLLYSLSLFGIIMISTLPLLLFAGLENLELSFNFSRASGAGGGIEKILYAFQTLLSVLPPWQITIPLLALWIFLVRWKKISLVWLFIGLTILYLSFSFTISPLPTTNFMSHLHLWLISIFAVLLCLGSLYSNRKSNRAQGKMLFLPVVLSGALGSIVLTASSSMTFYPAVYPLVFILLLALKEAAGDKRRLILFYLILMNVATLAYSYGYTYRDESIEKLNHIVEKGPYAGILTSENRGRLLVQVQQDIESLPSSRKTIFFLDSFPAGYLMSERTPATRSLFMHPLPTYYWLRDFYANYYSQAEHRPDVIFDFKFMDFSDSIRTNFHYPDESSSGDILRTTLYKGGGYRKIIERENYSVFLRNQ